jgi:hypothetical protein
MRRRIFDYMTQLVTVVEFLLSEELFLIELL